MAVLPVRTGPGKPLTRETNKRRKGIFLIRSGHNIFHMLL